MATSCLFSFASHHIAFGCILFSAMWNSCASTFQSDMWDSQKFAALLFLPSLFVKWNGHDMRACTLACSHVLNEGLTYMIPQNVFLAEYSEVTSTLVLISVVWVFRRITTSLMSPLMKSRLFEAISLHWYTHHAQIPMTKYARKLPHFLSLTP